MKTKLADEVLSPEKFKEWSKYLEQGQKLANSNKIRESIAPCKKALKLFPKDQKVNRILGDCYSFLKQYPVALNYYKKSLTIDPKNAKTLNNIASCYLRLNKFNEAIIFFKKSLQADKKNRRSWHGLAHCYVKIEKFTLAEKAIKKDISFGTVTPHKWQLYADILFYREKYSKAIEYYEKTIKKEPENFLALANVGIVCYFDGQFRKSREYLEKALKIKKNFLVYHFLGHTFTSLDRFDEAIDFFKSQKKFGSFKDDTSFQLGICYLGKKDFRNAIKLFNKSLKIEKNDKDALKHLGEAYLGLGDLKNSIKYFEKIKKLKNVKKKKITQKPLGDFPNPKHEIVPDSRKSKNVFVVHGHDTSTLRTVSTFLNSVLHLTPLVLDKLPPGGRYLMEKIEDYLSISGFVVVLLTADDIGYPKKKLDEESYRARQNVVLEYGLSRGALGRKKICILYKGNIELPSDILGVNYLEMDTKGKWKTLLTSDLKLAKMKIKK